MSISKPHAFDKPYLREYFREKRKILLENIKEKNALDAEIQARLIMSPEYRASKTVFIYMARSDEIATSAIIYAALANNKTVAVPRCDGDTMRFCRITDIHEPKEGRFGILEPPVGAQVIPPDEATLAVCPDLCCDMRGYRLGYGGGYYDRFLRGFRGVKAALCYSDSLVKAIETDQRDIPVDVIFTDHYTRRIGG